MKKPDITEGEWQVVHHTDNRIGVQSVEDSYIISSICNMSPFREEALENARLISAAPRMMNELIHSTNLLKVLLKTIDLGEMDDDVSMQIQENFKALEKVGVEL